GRKKRHTRLCRKTQQNLMSPPVIRTIKRRERKPDRPRKGACKMIERFPESRIRHGRRHGDETLPFPFRQHIFKPEIAFAFFGTPVAAREKSRKPPISGAITRISNHLKTIPQHKAHTRQKANACGLRRRMSAHKPGHCIAISNAYRFELLCSSSHYQFFRMRSATQKAEIARNREF